MPPRPVAPEYTTVHVTNTINVRAMSSCLGSNFAPATTLSISPTSSQDSDPTSVDAFLSELLQSVNVDDDAASSQASSINSPLALMGAAGGSSIANHGYHCTNCSRQLPAVFKCHECSEMLCESCVRMHRRLRATREHTIIKVRRESECESLSSSRSSNTPPHFSNNPSPHLSSNSPPHLGVCEIHCEPKLLYCESCVLGTCGACALNDHRGHSLIYLQDALAGARSACLALMADARSGAQAVKDSLEMGQQLSEAVETRANQAANEVRATIKRYVAAIEERQRELLSRVERARQLKTRTLLVQMDGLRLALSRLARTTDLLGEALEKLPPIDILHTNEKAAAELRTLRKLQLNLAPREDDFIVYTGPEPGLLRAVATMGCIQASSVAVALGTSEVPMVMSNLPPLPPAPRGRPILGSTEMITVRVPSPNVSPIIFGGEGDQDGKLCRPWGICCDRNGNILIADRSNNRIQVFRPDGSFLFKFGTHGNLPGQLDRPAGICCDSFGRIVVVDKDNHRVQIFTADGTFVLTFGEKGCKNGQFNYPWDVAANAQSQLVVADTRNHRIQLFGPDGAFLGKYGFEGASPMWKHFDSPRGVCFNPEGHILVTDFNNHRLVVIDPGFMQARFLGSEGTGEKQFLRPQGIICDDEGNFVVADSRNNRIQVFDHTGSLLWKVGAGPGKGPTEIDRPSGLCITHAGRIAVVDFGNHRVIMF